MSNQIVISSGAKVRELEGVLTGTAGIVNALGINVPSGIPQLDASGKILVSQLPNSVMEYKGTWNAATNTPTLADGTGNQGDVYLCNVAGTVNFGSGPIAFFVGDQVIYSGTIWQRASGATGTVTSVAVTESGDALSITGSPITTSGTINIGFTGTSGQYVNGAGGLTTFPTDNITGSGASGQVTYFNGTNTITGENAFNYDASTNRLGVNTTVPNATIGANAGIDSGYSLLVKNDNANYNGIGFGTDSTYGNLIATEKLGTAPARNLTLLNQSGYISITEVGNLGVNILNPNTGLDIYNGTSAYLWLHTATSGTSGTDGVRLALFNTNTANLRNFEGALSITAEGDFSVITLGAENIRVNSVDGKVGIGGPATVPEMLTVNGSIQQSGVLSSLLKTNGDGKLIAAVAGTDYVIPSALSAYVPTSRTLTINGVGYDLSANRSWTITSDITGSGADGRVAYWNGTNSITSEAGFIYDSSTNRLGVNTSVPNATIGADAALNSGYGLLIKTGASNYNGIGIAIDSTYGNTIETAKLGTASARNLTLLNQSGFVSLTESGNFGVGILTPNNGIDIYNSTQSQLWLHNAASGITGTDGVRLALFNNLSANLRNFDGGLSLTAEGDFSVITLGAENIRVNSANGFVGIGNPATLTNLLTVAGSASVNGNLVITKSSGLATINFPVQSGGNDVGYIQHDESISDTGIMRFSVGDNDLTNDYFVFGNTQTGTFLERFKILATGVVTIGTWQGSAIADAYISSASTWNAKQNQLNGTGFVKASGTTISYDNTSYLPLTGGTLTGSLGGTSATFSGSLGANGVMSLGNDGTYGSTYKTLGLTGNSNGSSRIFAGPTSDFMYLAASTGSGFQFRPNGSDSSSFTIGSDGNGTFIGISPILAIQSNTTGNLFLRFRQSADTMASMFYTNATATFTMSNNMGGLRFNTSGTSDAMNILSGGSVGINNTSPASNVGLSVKRPASTGWIIEALNGSNTRMGGFYVTGGNNGQMYLANSSGTENVVLDTAGTSYFNGGNVLIGGTTDVSGKKLQVYGDSYIEKATGNASLFMKRVVNDTQFEISVQESRTRIRTWSTANDRDIYFDTDNAGTTRMIIQGNGQINMSSLGTGTVQATSGTLSTISDMNLKDEDGFIDNALEKVMNLKPRYFHWKEESGLPTDLRQLGFFAQEVNEALGEEAANTPKSENDKWGIYDRGMIAFLTAAIQEQQAKIELQDAKIEELKALINK